MATNDRINRVTGKRLRTSLTHKVDVTVKTLANRDALQLYQRRWGMVVAVYEDGANNGLYVLEKTTSNRVDNSNWQRIRTQVIRMVDNPPLPTAAGELMELVICDDFLYICVEAGAEGVAKWKRAPLRNYNIT